MKKKILFSIVFSLFSATSALATTAKWLVQPEYDSIGYYSSDIFKCFKNGKIQLIDLTGKPLLPVEADSITDYAEGFALVLDRKGKALQIKGFLSEDSHDFLEVSGTYYATFYSHFSENYLVVADEKGKQGYLNTWGEVALPCQYKEACPFLQGWASVESEKDGAGYINKQGTYMIVDFHYGQLSLGTNFNKKGEALVGYTKKGQSDFAVINTNGKVVRKYRNRKGKPFREYDAAFSETGEQFVPKHNSTPTFHPGFSVFASDGMFGYADANQDPIVPAQFSYAGKVADNCAIVALSRLYGIITLIDGNFSSVMEKAEIAIQGNKANELQYALSIPMSMDNESIQIMFDHGDGIMRPIELNHGVYVFKPVVGNNATECTLRAQVTANGMLLWEETLHKKVKRASIVNVSFDAPTKLREYADADNNLTVSTTVRNTSDSPVTVSVSFSDPAFRDGSRNRISQRSAQDITLGPKEKSSFSLSLKVYELETVKISVSVKANQQPVGTKSAKIVLKPFDLIE